MRDNRGRFVRGHPLINPQGKDGRFKKMVRTEPVKIPSAPQPGPVQPVTQPKIEKTPEEKHADAIRAMSYLFRKRGDYDEED